MLCTGITLAGCSLNNGPATLLVDPGTYDAYGCKDLVAEWEALNKREVQLVNLMNKASAGGGVGPTIGSMTYSTDYQVVLTQKKLAQQAAAEKNCELEPSYKSDRTIR